MKENITAGKINLKLSLRVWLQRQKKPQKLEMKLKQTKRALPEEC